MAIEIEKKYRLSEAQKTFVLNALQEFGAEFVGEDFEENIVGIFAHNFAVWWKKNDRHQNKRKQNAVYWLSYEQKFDLRNARNQRNDQADDD